MQLIKGETFAEAYEEAMKLLFYNPEYKSRPRGLDIHECLNVGLYINDITQNLFRYEDKSLTLPTGYVKKEMCLYLGVADNVCSPTFSIVNEYMSSNGLPIYHFDFYRLKNLEETYDIGYEEYFFSGNYCFTEWTEKVEPLLPESYVRIDISEETDGTRKLEAKQITL
jgi:tRNA threonylcarbamoyladenosine biosynthesis protein TsaE